MVQIAPRFIRYSSISLRTLNLTITVAPIQLWKWQMYISQNLRQSWYGNILGEEDNDDDQDAMKVKTDRID